MLSGKLFSPNVIHKGLKSYYGIEMPDDSSARKLFDALTSEEKSVIRLLMHNARLHGTPEYFGCDETVPSGIPQPGIAEFENVARMNVDMIHSSSQSRETLNTLRASIKTMQKYDDDASKYEDFFRKFIIGNGNKSTALLDGLLAYDQYKAERKIDEFLDAMVICDAVQSLKIFLPKWQQVISEKELSHLCQKYIFAIIEAGKYRVFNALLECGFCQKDMRLQNGVTMLFSILFGIARTSWRYNWLLEELDSGGCHADNEQVRMLLVETCRDYFDHANQMLDVLVTNYQADADLEIPSLRQIMEGGEIDKVVYLNHHAKTGRELAAAYLADLSLQKNLPADLISMLEDSFTKVINAPQISCEKRCEI